MIIIILSQVEVTLISDREQRFREAVTSDTWQPNRFDRGDCHCLSRSIHFHTRLAEGFLCSCFLLIPRAVGKAVLSKLRLNVILTDTLCTIHARVRQPQCLIRDITISRKVILFRLILDRVPGHPEGVREFLVLLQRLTNQIPH